MNLNLSVSLSNVETIKPLTPRVNPWVILSFLTFDSEDRTLYSDHFIGKLLSSTVLWCCYSFKFYPVCQFFEPGLNRCDRIFFSSMPWNSKF